MVYIVCAILIIAGYIFKRSKIVLFSQYITLVIIMGGNNVNPDYLNYEYMFNNAYEILVDRQTREPIYLLLNLFAKNVGFNFQQFHFCFMALTILFLIYVIKSYTTFVSPILSMFFIYPMVESTIQIRTFFAMVLLLWAFKFLIKPTEKYGTFKYLSLVLIASMFHISFLFYAIFVIVKYVNIKSWVAIIQIVVFLICALIPIFPYIFTIFMNSSATYFTIASRLSTLKVLGMVVWHLSGLVLMLLICKTPTLAVPIDNRIYKLVMKANLATCIIFPLYFGGNTFMRLYRNIFILNYIVVNSKKESIFKAIYIVYILCTALFFNIIAGGGLVNVFRPIFKENIFFVQ